MMETEGRFCGSVFAPFREEKTYAAKHRMNAKCCTLFSSGDSGMIYDMAYGTARRKSGLGMDGWITTTTTPTAEARSGWKEARPPFFHHRSESATKYKRVATAINLLAC